MSLLLCKKKNRTGNETKKEAVEVEAKKGKNKHSLNHSFSFSSALCSRVSPLTPTRSRRVFMSLLLMSGRRAVSSL